MEVELKKKSMEVQYRAPVADSLYRDHSEA